MRLSEIKAILPELDRIRFELEDGTLIPEHFHVTEIGNVTKKFIDCGGTLRDESFIIFQLWYANDDDHRLYPEKLLKIIDLSEKELDLDDAEVEVEYQGTTIGRYGMAFSGSTFYLTNRTTACLARETCVAPDEKPEIRPSGLNVLNTECCGMKVNCC